MMTDVTLVSMRSGGGGGYQRPPVTVGRIGFRRRLRLWIHQT